MLTNFRKIEHVGCLHMYIKNKQETILFNFLINRCMYILWIYKMSGFPSVVHFESRVEGMRARICDTQQNINKRRSILYILC